MTDELLLALVAIGAKGALILSIALISAAVARNTSAARRHLLLGVASLALLVLLPMSWLMPSWHVPLVTTARSVRPPMMVHGSEVAPGSDRPLALPGSRANVVPATVAEPRTPVAQLAPAEQTPRALIGAWLGLVWLAGSLFLLAYQLLGVLHLSRSRALHRVVDEELLATCAALARKFGIMRPVTLYAGQPAEMPMTWGVLRPAIVLPAEWRAWSETRLRAVLEHELAHVARHDHLWQLAADGACALHWINPLVWVAARRMRRERECACDDMVVRSGTTPIDYAEHLLAIAQMNSGRQPLIPAAMAMARPSELEKRLLSIFDDARDRSTPTRKERWMVAIAIGLMLAPTAALRPWALRSNAQTTDDMSSRPPLAEPIPRRGQPARTTAPVKMEKLDQNLSARQPGPASLQPRARESAIQLPARNAAAPKLPYDSLPEELDALLELPYGGERGDSEGERDRAEGNRDRAEGNRDRAEGSRDRAQGQRDRIEGEREHAEGERVALTIRGALLRKYSRKNLLGSPDSAALASLAGMATAQWIAYQRGTSDRSADLDGERALWTLTKTDGWRIAPGMVRELRSADWRVRAYAAWALGRSPRDQAEAPLTGALDDPDRRVRKAAEDALMRLHR